MAGEVNVEDFEVFRQFRAALVKFAQAAELALSGADSDIRATQTWLEVEQTTYWVGQRRRRAELVQQARDAVRQKKLYKDASGRTPSAVEEEKALAKAMAALEESERKIEAIKKWMPKLAKANDLYRGGVARLNVTLGAEVPKAVALLDRLAESLESYVQIEAPSFDVMDTGGEGAMTRGEGAAMDAPPPAPAAEAPAEATPAEAAPAQQEGGHVADGQ
jgi:hypothetical protein